MIIGIGIDMIHIPRIYRLITLHRNNILTSLNQNQPVIIAFNERFSKRILNDCELTQLNNELSSFGDNKGLLYNYASKFLAVR